MNLIRRVWQSSLGKKYLMAISGCVLFLFVVGHLAGNLQVFLGPESLNRYGHFLQSNVELLWPVRSVLLLMVLLHVASAVSLSRMNKAARPVAYLPSTPFAASYASRTMLMSGLIIAAFIVYHLLHYTVEVPEVNLTGRNFEELVDNQGRHDVYAMMILGFRQPIVSLFYVIAIGLLCLHLGHGVAAMFQSMGWKNHVYGPLINKAAQVMAVAIFVGYVSIPVAVLAGLGGGYVKSANPSGAGAKAVTK